jgi:hypothetical protein
MQLAVMPAGWLSAESRHIRAALWAAQFQGQLHISDRSWLCTYPTVSAKAPASSTARAAVWTLDGGASSVLRGQLAPGEDPGSLTPRALLQRGASLTMVMMVAILDPPRDEVIDAIKVAHKAGIAVKMITGESTERLGRPTRSAAAMPLPAGRHLCCCWVTKGRQVCQVDTWWPGIQLTGQIANSKQTTCRKTRSCAAELRLVKLGCLGGVLSVAALAPAHGPFMRLAHT